MAIKGENRMAQTGKKPGKNRISEEDWKKYVDAVRRNARGQDDNTRKGKGEMT